MISLDNMNDYYDPRLKEYRLSLIEKAAEALLPFDKFVTAKLNFVDENSQIKSMGFTLMRMELEPATYSLGISIEISDSEFNDEVAKTMFITAFHTMEELKDYSLSKDFSNHVTEVFEAQIERCFYPGSNN